MIRVLAIDDEPLALRQLTTYISKVPFLELVSACPSAAEARKVLGSEDVDVLYVDINMPDVNGLDFVRSLSFPPLIVFTTAYSEYAVEGFKVDAVDYLLKPFGLDEFTHSAQKVKRAYDALHSEPQVAAVPADNSLFFKTDYRIVRVDLDRIVYVEGMSEYLKIHLDSGDPVVVLLSMKKLEERLSSASFLRVHKSYIINLSKLQEVTKGRVLVGGASIPVGDMYKDTLNAYIESKFMGR